MTCLPALAHSMMFSAWNWSAVKMKTRSMGMEEASISVLYRYRELPLVIMLMREKTYTEVKMLVTPKREPHSSTDLTETSQRAVILYLSEATTTLGIYL